MWYIDAAEIHYESRSEAAQYAHCTVAAQRSRCGNLTCQESGFWGFYDCHLPLILSLITVDGWAQVKLSNDGAHLELMSASFGN